MHAPAGGRRLGRSAWTRSEVNNVLREESTEFPDHLDSSPYATWSYVHRHCFANSCVFRYRNKILRKYGYVVWELPEDIVPTELHRRLRLAQQQAMMEQEEIEKKRPEMEQSWKERASIYAKGGRGYWDVGDTSRITWENKTTGECLDHAVAPT